jgi:hypothetical protein
MATTRYITRPQRVMGAYVLDTLTGAVRTGMATVGAQQLADHLNLRDTADQDTYAVRGSALKTTGHYRRPGTTQLYCGRPAGARNGIFATVTGWKLCTRCIAAKQRDRAEAAAVAEQHREDTTATDGAAQTWRSDWIGAQPDDTLFQLTPDREQGALFT